MRQWRGESTGLAKRIFQSAYNPELKLAKRKKHWHLKQLRQVTGNALDL
jgi:hypothetical protein